jgi:predicted PurR-regulated permease PerM
LQPVRAMLSEPTIARESVALRVLAFCAIVAALRFAAPVLLPIVISIFLFYALDPIVDRLESWRVPRIVAAVAVVAAFVCALAGGALALWPQIEAVVVKVPQGVQQLRLTLRERRQSDSISVALKRVQAAAQAIDQVAAESTASPAMPKGTMRVEVAAPRRASDMLWAGGASAIQLAGQTMTILFLTIFLLNEDDSFKRKLVRQMETRGQKRLTVSILDTIAGHMERFIWVQIVTSGGVALVTALALAWLGVEQAAVWGVLAGLLNIVPFFGPLVVSGILAAAGFLQFGTMTDAAIVAGTALAITTLEGSVVTPHLLSRAASLNLVATFISLAFWSWLWGIPGLLLAVPILMATKVICDNVDGFQPIGEFLGE